MANQYDFFNLMKAGGYNPMDGGITTNQMQDFRLQGLLNNMDQTNKKIDALNLPPLQQPNPQAELLKKQKKANMLMALGDLLKGKDATSGFSQRQAMFDAQQKEAERKAKQEQLKKDQDAFIKANPDLAQFINMNKLFGVTSPATQKVVTPNSYKEYERTTQNPTPEGYAEFLDRNKSIPKKTKSDYVVEILAKIQANPDYELTKADQRTLDTISSTDPLEIYKRQIVNSQINKTNTQVPSISTELVTVTTQKEFDNLPEGTTYIYNGTEYVKGK